MCVCVCVCMHLCLYRSVYTCLSVILLVCSDRELLRLGDIVDQLETENERKAHLIAELNHTQKSKQSSGVVTSPSSERVRTPEDGRMSRQTERKSFRQKLSLAFGK